jgi:predicted small metal-binding protein
MAKTLACSDVVSGCGAKFKGETEDEILAQAAQHAKNAHGMEKIDDQTLAAVRGAIKSEN